MEPWTSLARPLPRAGIITFTLKTEVLQPMFFLDHL